MNGFDSWGFPAQSTGRPFTTEDPWSQSQPAPQPPLTEASGLRARTGTDGQTRNVIDLEETQSDLGPSHFGDTQQVHRRLQFSQAPSAATWVDEMSQSISEPVPASQFNSYFAKKKTYHKLRKHMKVDPQPRYVSLKTGGKLRYSTVCDPSEKENYLMCGHCSDQRLFKTMQILERHGLECPGKMQELLGSQVYASVQPQQCPQAGNQVLQQAGNLQQFPQQAGNPPFPQQAGNLQFPQQAGNLPFPQQAGIARLPPPSLQMQLPGMHAVPNVVPSNFSTPSHTMTTPNSSFPPITQPSSLSFYNSQPQENTPMPDHTVQGQVMSDPIVCSQPAPTLKGRVIFPPADARKQEEDSKTEPCQSDATSKRQSPRGKENIESEASAPKVEPPELSQECQQPTVETTVKGKKPRSKPAHASEAKLKGKNPPKEMEDITNLTRALPTIVEDAAGDAGSPTNKKRLLPATSSLPSLKLPRPCANLDTLPYAFAKAYTSWFTEWRQEDHFRLLGVFSKSQTVSSMGTQTQKSPSPLKECSYASEGSREEDDLLLPTPCIASQPVNFHYLAAQSERHSPLFTDASPTSSREEFCIHGANDMPRRDAPFRRRSGPIPPTTNRLIPMRDDTNRVCHESRFPGALVRLCNGSGARTEIKKEVAHTRAFGHMRCNSSIVLPSHNSAVDRKAANSGPQANKLQKGGATTSAKISGADRASLRIDVKSGDAQRNSLRSGNGRISPNRQKPYAENAAPQMVSARLANSRGDPRVGQRNGLLRDGSACAKTPAQAAPPGESGDKPFTSHRPPNRLQRTRAQDGRSPHTEPKMCERAPQSRAKQLARRHSETSLDKQRRRSARPGQAPATSRRRDVANEAGQNCAAWPKQSLSGNASRDASRNPQPARAEAPGLPTPPAGSSQRSIRASSLRPMNKLQRLRAQSADRDVSQQRGKEAARDANPGQRGRIGGPASLRTPLTDTPELFRQLHHKLHSPARHQPFEKSAGTTTRSARSSLVARPGIIASDRPAVEAPRLRATASESKLARPNTAAVPLSNVRPAHSIPVKADSKYAARESISRTSRPKKGKVVSAKAPLVHKSHSKVWREASAASKVVSARGAMRKTASAQKTKSPFNEKIAMQAILNRVMLAASRKPSHGRALENAPCRSNARPPMTRTAADRLVSSEAKVNRKRSAGCDKELNQAKRAR